MVSKELLKKMDDVEFMKHIDFVIDFISNETKNNRKYFMNAFNVLSEELKRRGL